MRKLIKENKYDVVHDHRSYLSGQSLKAAAHEGVRVRIMGHHAINDERLPGVLRGIYEWLLKKWSLKYATDIVGCSKTALSEHYGCAWETNEKFKVIYASINPVPASKNAREKLRKQLNIRDDDFVIGFVGRMAEAKNPQICIKVISGLLKIRQDLVLVMIGDGPLLDKVKEDAVVMGCVNRVRFTGFVDNVPDYLQAIDIFFQPSLIEGFGLAKLEALQAGLPVVGSNVPGFAEGLPVDCLDHLSDATDVIGYVQTINKIIENGCQRRDYSETLKKFAPANFYSQLLGVYKKKLKLT
jgi:glycosyltransferase involved in cell wall biosynthesis